MSLQLLLPPAPANASASAQAHLDQLHGTQLAPFAPATLAFLDAFARRILQDHALRESPEIIALAYWFRPAALAQLRGRYERLGEHGLLRPRGVALHIAPANVDAVFVYAWFLSLLCGNRNIVRLSRRESPQRTQLLAILAELLSSTAHTPIAQSNAVVSYAHDDALTAHLSASCNLRVVWGGDASVAHLRRIPLPPLATELVFPNRFAWAMLGAQAIVEASASELDGVAKAFYNDAFWFAQQACSSPRAVLWLGPADTITAAQARFWPALAKEITQHHAQSDGAQAAARLVAAHLAASHTPLALQGSLGDWPLRLQLDHLDPSLRSQHCGYGLFYELQRSSLAASCSLFTAQDQTIAYWGLPAQAFKDWLTTLPDRAVDRIVKLGNALHFADRWDGHDLLQAFSRQVIIE